MAGQQKHLEEVEGRPTELSLLFEISQALDSSLDRASAGGDHPVSWD
jgi:hypothetical protein